MQLYLKIVSKKACLRITLNCNSLADGVYSRMIASWLHMFLLDFYFYSFELAIVHVQINFLSQIRLSNKGDGPKVAKRLIDVYFAVFKVLVYYISCAFCTIS